VEHNAGTGRSAEFVSLEGNPPYDHEHTMWIDSVLQSISDIKLGMARRDLLKVFATEGGISTPSHRTFALRGCPYVKVDVDFSLSGNAKQRSTESLQDTIVKISRPYLEYSVMD
jgi:hypothetical protein